MKAILSQFLNIIIFLLQEGCWMSEIFHLTSIIRHPYLTIIRSFLRLLFRKHLFFGRMFFGENFTIFHIHDSGSVTCIVRRVRYHCNRRTFSVKFCKDSLLHFRWNCQFPVGSSARINFGLVTKALATAALCC
jgi:hypothetical protein